MLSLFHLTSTRDPEDNVMSSLKRSELIAHCGIPIAVGPPEGFVGCETGDKTSNASPSDFDGKIDISTVG